MSPKDYLPEDGPTVSGHETSPGVGEASFEQQSKLATTIQRARTTPGSLSAGDVLHLQRTIGNQAVSRLLAARDGHNEHAAADRSKGADASTVSYSVVQRFTPLPIDRVIIDEIKGNEKLANQGWTSDHVDELVTWSKSMKQLRSIVENTHYDDWREIKAQFANGSMVSTRIGSIWREYQANHTETTTLDSFEGYKGSPGTEWRHGQEDRDWSGCYIGMTPEQAEGYVTEIEDGVATVWKCTLEQPLTVTHVRGRYIASPHIKGEAKASTMKQVLQMEQTLLIPGLGKKKQAYLGPESDEREELVVPWSIVNDYFTVKKHKMYEIKKHSIVKSWDPNRN